jgi:hypothetical protein
MIRIPTGCEFFTRSAMDGVLAGEGSVVEIAFKVDDIGGRNETNSLMVCHYNESACCKLQGTEMEMDLTNDQQTRD